MAVSGELVWRWLTRLCAVSGFGTLLIRHGLDAPATYYVLLTGLFFGSEILKGEIKFIAPKRDDESA